MPKSIYTPKYKHLRALLIEARKRAGLSQTELAERLGHVQTYVSKYERGERRLDIVEFFELAAALQIDPFRFLRRLFPPHE